MKLLAIAALCALPSVAAADGKPLLSGTYEWGHVHPAKDKDFDFTELATKQLPNAVWAHMTMTFSGAELTVAVQALTKDAAGYHGCESAVTMTIEWSKTGFRNPTKVGSTSRGISFKKLDAMSESSTADDCTAGFDAGVFEVVPSTPPKLKFASGTLITLTKVSPDVDWKKHVK